VSAPYLIRNPSGVDGYEGFIVDLLNALGESLGCRFIIREVADGRYGTKKEGTSDSNKEEWTGMVGEVMRGEADLAVADMTVTAARSLVVDFTQPILDNYLVAVANKKMAAVTSLAELAARDDVKFLVNEGGSTSKFFQFTKDPVYRAIAGKIRYCARIILQTWTEETVSREQGFSKVF